jgi:sugar phosphate isomerase/epimerase
MKFAICNEIFQEWNDIARTFNYVKEIGYDGIELAPFTFSQYVTDISPETRKEIVNRAREVDLDVIGIHWVFVVRKACTSIIPTRNTATVPPSTSLTLLNSAAMWAAV